MILELSAFLRNHPHERIVGLFQPKFVEHVVMTYNINRRNDCIRIDWISSYAPCLIGIRLDIIDVVQS